MKAMAKILIRFYVQFLHSLFPPFHPKTEHFSEFFHEVSIKNGKRFLSTVDSFHFMKFSPCVGS